MNTEQIRNEYLKFFEGRAHAVIKRAPLVLHDDPTGRRHNHINVDIYLELA